MTRGIVVLTLIALLTAVPAAQTPAPKVRVNLSSLGIGPVYSIRPVEADGRPGPEWLLQRSPASPGGWGISGEGFWATFWVAYPNGARSGENGTVNTPGLCIAGPVRFNPAAGDALHDIDSDGRLDIVAYDVFAQVVTVTALPTGRCLAQD